MHPGDNRDIVHDKGFQGFGHDITDENGGYRFRTIKPVSYPGRTPHIHVKLLDGNRELLTTQFYIRTTPTIRRPRFSGGCPTRMRNGYDGFHRWA